MKPATIATYLEMLTYKRPHGSYEEQEFIFDFIDIIPGIQEDAFGNRLLTIGETPKTCFSAHVDTVHFKGGKQTVLVDDTANIAFKGDNECLGADDASGCIVLMKLIQEQVPGLYIFHRGEERGGLGSRWIAKNTPEIFDNIDHCVAFDRRATSSIITFQRGTRCCSQDFVDALSAQFTEHGDFTEVFTADPGGSFTDSASYTDLVSECTNISIGYYDEHSGMESQDLEHLLLMMQACPRIDWASLPATRDTTIKESKWANSHGGGYCDYDNDWWNTGAKKKKNKVGALPPPKKSSGTEGVTELFPTTFSYNTDTKETEPNPITWSEALQFIRQYPLVTADIIDDIGLTPDELLVYFNAALHQFGEKGV